MKKLNSFILFSLLTFLFSTKNISAINGYNTIKSLSFLNKILMISDQLSLNINNLEDCRNKIHPELNLSFLLNCSELTKKYLPENLHGYLPQNYNVYVPIIIDKILNSSVEETESLTSIIIDLFIFIQYLNNISQDNHDIDIKQKSYASSINIAQKTCEIGINNILNNTLENKPISKRLLKTILFSSLEALKIYTFQVILLKQLSSKFPEIIQGTIIKTCECIFVETCAEIINRIFIPQSSVIKHNAFLEKLIP
ncbi:hypothetical protein ACFLYH_02955 [Candidatus Dependentiae bacterium]